MLHPAWSEEERALLQLSGCSRVCWEQPAKDGDVLELRRRGLCMVEREKYIIRMLSGRESGTSVGAVSSWRQRWAVEHDGQWRHEHQHEQPNGAS